MFKVEVAEDVERNFVCSIIRTKRIAQNGFTCYARGSTYRTVRGVFRWVLEDIFKSGLYVTSGTAGFFGLAL